MATHKISGEQTYERELGSKALVATDKNALLQHRRKMKDSVTILSLSRELNTLRKEFEDLRNEVRRMKITNGPY